MLKTFTGNGKNKKQQATSSPLDLGLLSPCPCPRPTLPLPFPLSLSPTATSSPSSPFNPIRPIDIPSLLPPHHILLSTRPPRTPKLMLLAPDERTRAPYRRRPAFPCRPLHRSITDSFREVTGSFAAAAAASSCGSSGSLTRGFGCAASFLGGEAFGIVIFGGW